MSRIDIALLKYYRIIYNKGTTLIRAPPIVWPKPKVPKITKVTITPLSLSLPEREIGVKMTYGPVGGVLQ